MKRIYTILTTAALMLVGITLWSGCSNDELLLDNPKAPDADASQQVASFSFNLKGKVANTRATGTITDTDLNYILESEVKTLYVAFFQKDAVAPAQSPLHRIYCCDAGNTGWSHDLIFSETMVGSGSYKIAEAGTIGNYVIYFIANPDKVIKDQLKAWQDDAVNVTLTTFETGLYTDAGTADGATGETSKVETVAENMRGFIMMSKEDIALEASTQREITLTRLASRFDFINSTISGDDKTEVKITKIVFNNSGKKSIVTASAGDTDAGSLETKTVEIGAGVWDKQSTDYFTTYMYENTRLNNGVANIEVYYTLNGTDKKKLTINLKEEDKNIGVTRNHLYRIYLNGVSGTYTLTVKDWGTGETVTVPNDKLIIEYKDTDLGKIGDFVYLTAAGELAFSDGGLRTAYIDGSLKWDDNLANIKPKTDLGTCVGIVFSNRVSEKDKGRGWTGYAVGLTAATTMQARPWSSAEFGTKDDPDIPNVTTVREMANDMDGYSHCQVMESHGATYYQAVKAYQPALPAETTGWYIPSAGQFVDICCNFGNFNFRTANQDTNISHAGSTTSGGITIFFKGNRNTANAFFQRAGKTGLFTTNNDNITTSSEVNQYHGVYFNIPSGTHIDIKLCGYLTKSSFTTKSFAVFAFTKK